MESAPGNEELQGDMALQRQVAEEIKTLLSVLKGIALPLDEGGALTGAQVMADHIRDNGQVWNNCPILLAYYNLRVRLGSFAYQYCDDHTQSFLHWLWQSAGTLEMPHPFPHFLRSVVASLVAGETGFFQVSLFVAVATTSLTVDDAAALVVVNLPTGEPGRYPSPRGRELLAHRLCTVYDLLVKKMGGKVLAERVIQGHLFVRSAPEWSLRVTKGGYTNQSGWLLRMLETYHWYLAERSKDIDRFFSRGAIDTTVVKRTEQANA